MIQPTFQARVKMITIIISKLPIGKEEEGSQWSTRQKSKVVEAMDTLDMEDIPLVVEIAGQIGVQVVMDRCALVLVIQVFQSRKFKYIFCQGVSDSSPTKF